LRRLQARRAQFDAKGWRGREILGDGESGDDEDQRDFGAAAHVVERVKKTLAAIGLAERCEAVAGDFFQAVPPGDVMLLKQILHDWNDEQCTVLLRNCAESLSRGGRVLVVEMLISEDGRPCGAHLTDVNMLVLLPGRERTATEYGQLFAEAGLKLERVHPTQSAFSIVEAVKD
jgi:hypothetical protein